MKTIKKYNNKKLYGLFRKTYPKYVQQYLDIDRIVFKQLPQEDLEWYAQFLKEYYHTSFIKNKEDWIHQDRSELWEPKNARKRDIFALANCNYKNEWSLEHEHRVINENEEEYRLQHYQTQEQIQAAHLNVENSIIDRLDNEEVEDTEISGYLPETIILTIELKNQTVVAQAVVYKDGAGYLVREVKLTDTQGRKAFISGKEHLMVVKSIIQKRAEQEKLNKKEVLKKELMSW